MSSKVRSARSESEDSRLQTAELIISLASSAHAKNSMISTVPTTTSDVVDEKVAQSTAEELIMSVLADQMNQKSSSKDTIAVTEMGMQDSSSETRDVPEAVGTYVIIDTTNQDSLDNMAIEGATEEIIVENSEVESVQEQTVTEGMN